jgi:phosphoglycolate phosphatase
MPRGTVVFDLDGTLVDTSRDLIAAANACFEGLGRGAPLDPRADAAIAFRGGRAMLRAGFTRLGSAWGEADVDREFASFLAFYGERIDAESLPYPGAAEAVAALRAAGYATAICTNKPAGLSEELLRRLDLWSLFDAHIGADSLPVRKPDPAPLLAAIAGAGGRPEMALLLGDTETDAQTARAAGVPLALVTFGPEGQGVAALAPDALLDAYADLGGLVARLIG